MLVNLAIGDAYGLQFEYAPHEVFAGNDTESYGPHQLYNLSPGSYSDDTQMSIANAIVLCATPAGQLPTKDEFAAAYVDSFKRDPREGYAKRFYALLQQVSSGPELLSLIIPTSERSGAAMRAPVIGLLPNIDLVLEVAKVQASVTHDTPAGIEAARAAALMAHFFRYHSGDKTLLRAWVVQHLGGRWSTPHSGPVDELGFSAVNAALTAIELGQTTREMLHAAIAFEGDVDTVGAIAMGCVALAPEIINDLPKSLYLGLENGPYGRYYLEEMSLKLATQFGRR